MFIAHEHELRVDTLKSVSFVRSTAFTKCNGLLLLLHFNCYGPGFCYRFHMNGAKKKSFVWWRFFSTHCRIQNGSSRCLSAYISPSVCLYTNICVHVSMRMCWLQTRNSLDFRSVDWWFRCCRVYNMYMPIVYPRVCVYVYIFGVFRLPLTACLKFAVPCYIKNAPLRARYSSDKEQDDEKEIQLGNDWPEFVHVHIHARIRLYADKLSQAHENIVMYNSKVESFEVLSVIASGKPCFFEYIWWIKKYWWAIEIVSLSYSGSSWSPFGQLENFMPIEISIKCFNASALFYRWRDTILTFNINFNLFFTSFKFQFKCQQSQ